MSTNRSVRFAGATLAAVVVALVFAAGCPVPEAFQWQCSTTNGDVNCNSGGSCAEVDGGTSNECMRLSCNDAGSPELQPRDKGASCSNGSKKCDGSGNCVECLSAGDCASTQHCDGTRHQCVDKCYACSKAHTGLDDGTCGPVLAGQDPWGDCADEGGCGATAGTCQCRDGEKNGNETATDCGGPCGKCLADSCTNNGDCASGFCVDHVCCESACDGPCKYCNSSTKPGQCIDAPAGYGDTTGTAPVCPNGYVCGPTGVMCAGVAGTLCGPGLPPCLSKFCTQGQSQFATCSPSPLGGACNTDPDCAAGTCKNYICSQ